MGRASRKTSAAHWTETHPDRHMWSPGRLAIARMQTREEYEALYGRATTTEAEARLRSVFWTSPELISRLSQEALSAKERIEFLSYLDTDFLEEAGPEELVRDRAFRKFFEDEWNGLPDHIRAKLGAVRSEMQSFLAEGLLIFARTYSGADVYDDPARDQAPSSLLGAAVWSGAIDGGDIAEALDRELVLSEILPQLEYLRRIDSRNEPNAFLQKTWHELWKHCGSPDNFDLESDLQRIDDAIKSAYGGNHDRYFAYFSESEEARRCRVYRYLFQQIGGERNLGDMFREAVLEEQSLGPAFGHARQRALAWEIERIFLLHEDSDQIFSEMMTDLMEDRPRRLEALRPLFKGKEELLREAEEYLEEESSLHPHQLAATVKKAIRKGCEKSNFPEAFHRVIIDELR